MYPLWNQEMARLHRDDLQREAMAERSAASVNERGDLSDYMDYARFSRLLDNRTSSLYGRRVVSQQLTYSNMNLDEIKHALQTTLATIRAGSPEDDEQAIEAFMQKLKSQLPPPGELLLIIQPPTPGQRLLSILALLCVLMPLIGMMIGISQGILVGGSLLCLAVVALGLVLKHV
jgi:hypothetical protein